jgi:hypothetical protein
MIIISIGRDRQTRQGFPHCSHVRAGFRQAGGGAPCEKDKGALTTLGHAEAQGRYNAADNRVASVLEPGQEKFALSALQIRLHVLDCARDRRHLTDQPSEGLPQLVSGIRLLTLAKRAEALARQASAENVGSVIWERELPQVDNDALARKVKVIARHRLGIDIIASTMNETGVGQTSSETTTPTAEVDE